jgi:hypothetical protein
VKIIVAFACFVDSDPQGSALILISWNQIQEGKNDPQKQKKVKKFHVLMCLMFFSFEG